MDMFQAMNTIQNPQGALMQYAMQGMIAQHPNEWNRVQQMFNSKNKKQQMSMLKDLYKQKNMDLDAVAKQWGINI